VVNKDFSPVQAFVLVSALFSLGIYLLVDAMYTWISPRVGEA
jgi:ABC-type dipeptide/oligopeptide/nickel transport system permease component